jgi:FkbM family methyltransferase
MKKFLKQVYRFLPFKKPFFLFIKQFGIPNHNIYQHLHFVDNIKVEVGETKNFKIRHYGFQLENEIFWNGLFSGWEKVSISIWAELCKSSSLIFDIGSNTGVYALLAKTINPNAEVFAFEPVDRVYDKLVYNNALNRYNINCIKKAISNFDGEATIYDKNTEHTYSVTVNTDTSIDKENSIETTIKTIRLDTFVTSNKLPKIDLLKVDVETHEIEALEGFGIYLKKFEPTFIIEILNDDIAKGIEKIISNIDYSYYIIDEKSGIKKVDHLKKSDYYNFLICKPEIANTLKTIKRFTRLYNEN